ncbi:MAG: Hsp20 family protein [Caldithrix sp.]|nr:Hsp20 family protein [Caldithrix sp.]
MALVHWNPSRNLLGLRDEMDRLFENFLTPEWRTTEGQAITPVLDMEENENEYIVSAELPGMNKDDVKITFQNNTLTLSGEKKAEKEINEENYHRVERRYGKFCRTVNIPGEVKNEDIEASFNDGILKIHMPKAEESKRRQIEVKVK